MVQKLQSTFVVPQVPLAATQVWVWFLGPGLVLDLGPGLGLDLCLDPCPSRGLGLGPDSCSRFGSESACKSGSMSGIWVWHCMIGSEFRCVHQV